MFSCIVSSIKTIHDNCRSYPTLTQVQGQASLHSVLRTLEPAAELGAQATMHEWTFVRNILLTRKYEGGI